MADDIEFQKLADHVMEDFFTTLSELDPDEVDADLAMGVLTMEFADGTKCIMNRQVAAHQIWLAYGATAWHFEHTPAGDWADTKGRGPLRDVLQEVLSQKLGKPIAL